MNVRFRLAHIEFHWDSDKAATNTSKHGLSFERACEVFLDPLLQFWDASAGQQERFAALGEVLNGDVVFVVHIEFELNTFRIISARHATKSEIARYENNG